VSDLVEKLDFIQDYAMDLTDIALRGFRAPELAKKQLPQSTPAPGQKPKLAGAATAGGAAGGASGAVGGTGAGNGASGTSLAPGSSVRVVGSRPASIAPSVIASQMMSQSFVDS